MFVPDGDSFTPTEWAVGPWSKDLLQASAFGGLLARALEIEPARGGTGFEQITVHRPRVDPREERAPAPRDVGNRPASGPTRGGLRPTGAGVNDAVSRFRYRSSADGTFSVCAYYREPTSSGRKAVCAP